MKSITGQFVVVTRRMTLGAVLLGTTLFAFAQEPLFQPASAPGDVTFAQLEVGVDSPIKKSGVKVIQNDDQWKDFLTKMDELKVKRPKIDWTKYQIVVATLEGSQNSGITMHVSKLHNVKAGKTNIEFVLDNQTGNSRLINTTTSENYLGKTQYPYAIIQTPIMSTKWNIKVDE